MNHFSWDLSELNGREFHALSNALRLKSGGQLEPTFIEIDTRDEELGNVNETVDDDVASNAADLISDFSAHEQLKKRFLNRLAELAANEKRAGTVACTAMREFEDGVVVWISRNEGFEKRDIQFFGGLALMLTHQSRTSGSGEEEALERKLWPEMVAYYKSRLESFYIPQLRAAFKSWTGIGSKNSNDEGNSNHAFDSLQELSDICFEAHNSKQFTSEHHQRLVLKSYELWRNMAVETLLQKQSASSKSSQHLWLQICFLGRLRAAYEAFKHATNHLASFGEVTITCIPTDKKKYPPLTPTLSLDETLKSISKRADRETFQNCLPKKYKGSPSKARKDFDKFQRSPLFVHAEVQMVLYLSASSQYGHIFEYFGCSKHSCFTCWHFLQAYGKVATRGCHGQLPQGWTIPEHNSPSQEQLDQLTQAIKTTRGKFKKELQAEFRHQRNAVKQSSAGSVSTNIPERRGSQANPSVAKFMQDHMDTERYWRFVGAFRDIAPTTYTSSDTPVEAPIRETGPSRIAEPESTFGICDNCERETDRNCGDCGKDWFCSKLCEKGRTTRHLFRCSGGRPLTTADYLHQDCVQDIMPTDEDVRNDFWFSRLPSAADQSKLLGLYKGLWYIHEAEGIDPPDALHKWRVEGSLVENIIKTFHTIPEKNRGGYFPWFLENREIFERQETPEQSLQRMATSFREKGKTFLDPEDREKDPSQLQPEAKRDCYSFFVMMHHHMHPSPDQELWYRFGFCVCATGWLGEMALGGLYMALIIGDKIKDDMLPRVQRFAYKNRGCTFTEFWKAYESSTLIDLMDSKGLREERLRLGLRNLEYFLRQPINGMRESVWMLKQFLAEEESFKAPNPLLVDYGFLYCKGYPEIMDLKKVYQTLLERADALELHRACISGKIFEFAVQHMEVEERFRSLMKNPYPLPELE